MQVATTVVGLPEVLYVSHMWSFVHALSVRLHQLCARRQFLLTEEVSHDLLSEGVSHGAQFLSGPVDPSSGVGVDVDQNKPLHRVWVSERELGEDVGPCSNPYSNDSTEVEKLQNSRNHLCDGVHGGILVIGGVSCGALLLPRGVDVDQGKALHYFLHLLEFEQGREAALTVQSDIVAGENGRSARAASAVQRDMEDAVRGLDVLLLSLVQQYPSGQFSILGGISLTREQRLVLRDGHFLHLCSHGVDFSCRKVSQKTGHESTPGVRLV